MAVLNRCAIVVAPREPMRAWTRPFQTRDEIEALDPGESLYLVPTFDDEQGARLCLERHGCAIFEAELDLWCRDRQLWPAPRTTELFLQWFHVRWLPLVEDLGEAPLQAYDLEGRLLAGPPGPPPR